MGNPVVHFEVTGKDGAALARYYGDLFGWKTTLHEASGYGMVDTDSGGHGGGGGINTSTSVAAHPSVCSTTEAGSRNSSCCASARSFGRGSVASASSSAANRSGGAIASHASIRSSRRLNATSAPNDQPTSTSGTGVGR